MQVTVESTGKLERRMRVELPADRIDQEVDSRLKSVGRTAKIKGFRPGKVPARVVRQRYGKQIREEVLTELMQKSYSDAVTQQKLRPAGGPTIETADEQPANTFAYIATFEVLPDIELGNLDRMEVERPEVSIDDADLDQMIDKLRHQKADWHEVERESRDGDRVTCDFSGTLKGEPIDGGQGSNVPVILGDGQMLPDFEKGLSGVRAGTQTSFKVKFPKDYHAADLQGKKVDFEVSVNKVEEIELPEVDDDFAAMFGIDEGGIERFKADVRDNMEREARQKARTDVREQVMAALLAANPIDVPQTLVDQEIHGMQHEAMQRMGIEDHDQAPPAENFAEAAQKRVRLGLLLRQVIADQSISIGEQQVRAHVESLCAGYENPDQMVELYMSNPQVIQQVEPVVLEQAAIDWLLENGRTKDRAVSFSEYMNS